MSVPPGPSSATSPSTARKMLARGARRETAQATLVTTQTISPNLTWIQEQYSLIVTSRPWPLRESWGRKTSERQPWQPRTRTKKLILRKTRLKPSSWNSQGPSRGLTWTVTTSSWKSSSPKTRGIVDGHSLAALPVSSLNIRVYVHRRANLNGFKSLVLERTLWREGRGCRMEMIAEDLLRKCWLCEFSPRNQMHRSTKPRRITT
ncbi:hypothetical protein C8R46DRAFT_314150 [Mycena filopes]|nr:hypothetical protein C8R46DRAFT_314150 [Mycena filopes]